MATLSDRLINSSKDIFDQTCQSDVVQNPLMTGDLSGNNKAFFQRTLRIASELKDTTIRILPKLTGLSGLKPEEKRFVDQMSADLLKVFGKHLDEFNAAVGPLPEAIRGEPLNKHFLAYLNLFDEVVSKGSVVHIWTVDLAGYALPVAIQDYLSAHPSHKANVYTDLVLMKSFGFEQAMAVMKNFIDNRASEVTPALEKELMTLFRQQADNQLQIIRSTYSGQ